MMWGGSSQVLVTPTTSSPVQYQSGPVRSSTSQSIIQPTVVPATTIVGSVRLPAPTVANTTQSPANLMVDTIQSYENLIGSSRLPSVGSASLSPANMMMDTIQSYENLVGSQRLPSAVTPVGSQRLPSAGNASQSSPNMMMDTIQNYEGLVKSLEGELTAARNKVNELTAVLGTVALQPVNGQRLEEQRRQHRSMELPQEEEGSTTCPSMDDLSLPSYMAPTQSSEQKPRRQRQHGEMARVSPPSRGFGTTSRGLLIPFEMTRTACLPKDEPEMQPRTRSRNSSPRNSSPRKRSQSRNNSPVSTPHQYHREMPDCGEKSRGPSRGGYNRESMGRSKREARGDSPRTPPVKAKVAAPLRTTYGSSRTVTPPAPRGQGSPRSLTPPAVAVKPKARLEILTGKQNLSGSLYGSQNLSGSMSLKALRGGSFGQNFEETFAANVKGHWAEPERTYWPNNQAITNQSSIKSF